MYDSASGGGSCASTDSADSSGLVLTLLPVGGGIPRVVGVVPDGVGVTATNRDGSAASVTMSGNAYALDGDAQLQRVTIHAPTGNVDLPAIPDNASS